MQTGRELNKLDYHEIVERLVGPIDPIGETNSDIKRFKNLESMLDLIYDLLRDVYYVAENDGRQEYSIAKAGKEAVNFFEEIKEEFF